MSFSRQLDLLSSLFRYRFQASELLDTFEALIKRISELEQRRNTVLHSFWLLESADPAEATRFKITAKRKKGLSHSAEVTKPEDLDRIAESFEQALMDFTKFMIPLVSSLQLPPTGD